MAKNLTDLTARTATADTDLLHINSGGTDYKETKANFTKDLSKYKNFATDSLLTSQIDALGAGVYSGVISSSGHQSETGVPQNAPFYVNAVVGSTGAYAIINLETASTVVRRWYKSKASGTWDSSWTELPSRSEIDTLNEKVKYLGSILGNSSSSFTVANGTYALVFTLSTGAARNAGWFVYATNSGIVYAMEMFTPGTNVSISTNTNQITITNSHPNNTTQACCVVFNGSITVPA